jgi:hypothetical protein
MLRAKEILFRKPKDNGKTMRSHSVQKTSERIFIPHFKKNFRR